MDKSPDNLYQIDQVIPPHMTGEFSRLSWIMTKYLWKHLPEYCGQGATKDGRLFCCEQILLSYIQKNVSEKRISIGELFVLLFKTVRAKVSEEVLLDTILSDDCNLSMLLQLMRLEDRYSKKRPAAYDVWFMES